MLRRAFRSLLNPDDPPERTALAFAIGTLIGFYLRRIGHGGFLAADCLQWRQLLPFAVGGTILSILCSLVSCPLMLYVLRSYRRKRAQAAPSVKKSITRTELNLK